MVKIALKILLILILAVGQVALMTKFSIFGAIPNLVLVFAIALVIKNRFRDGLLVAFLGGLILDLSSSLWFGFYLFFMLVIIVAINFLLLRTIPAPNNLIVFFIYFASFLFLNLMIFLFARLWPTWFVLVDGLINSLWAIIIYVLVRSKIKEMDYYVNI